MSTEKGRWVGHLRVRFDAGQHPAALPVGEGDQVEKAVFFWKGAEDARAVEGALKGGQFAQIDGKGVGKGGSALRADHRQFIKVR